MTRAGAISSAFRLRCPVVLLSILLHVALLLPIGLAVPRLMRPAPIEHSAIPLDLSPVRFSRARPPRTTETRPAPAASSPVSVPQPREPLPNRAAETAPPPATTLEVDPRWRVQADESAPAPRSIGRVARIPCPAAPGDRLGQRVCMTGSAMHSPDMPERMADLRRAGPDGLEQTREDGFERQRQANEAWRDYTRGEGAYPGLRSLFSER